MSSDEKVSEGQNDTKYIELEQAKKRSRSSQVEEGGTPKELEIEEKAKHEEPTCFSSFKSYMLEWVNLLLVFVPIGIVLGALDQPPTAVFIVNFLAIIPLAKLLGTATENIAARTSQAIGALLNASFGNAVELIVGIIALVHGLVRVVQASLIGSVLSNLLLVLGTCFVVGGAKYKTQTFNQSAAQTSGSILLMAVFGALLPAALNAQLTQDDSSENSTAVNTSGTDSIDDKLLQLSRGTSIILLIVYGLYLFFQLVTHKHLYQDDGDDEEEPELTMVFSICSLVVVTVLVAVCAEYLVDSIDGIVAEWGISQTFVGIIILPIVGNAAEHLTAVSVAYKNKMDLAIGVAIGSSQQIALMVTPLLVILGWIINVQMTLYFQTFETAVLFICVIVVNALIMDGESNWLEGVLLLAVYIICAIAFYVSG